MKTNSLAFILALAFLTTGCGALKVSPAYTATQKGPLSEVPASRVNLQLSDERASAERVEVGRLYNAFGGVARTFESTEPVPDVVRNAIKSELEMNGHKVVAPSENPDVQLNVSVKRFFYECKPKMWDVEVVMTAITDVQVVRGGKNSPPITISGTHRDSRQMVTPGAHVKIINKGLAEFARNVALDPALSENLKPVSTAQK